MKTKIEVYTLLLQLEVEAAYRSRLRDYAQNSKCVERLAETEAKILKLENQIIESLTKKECVK